MMNDPIELRFEFPNGTVIQALDYECGYEYEPGLIYRKDAAPNAISLTDYKVSGYLIVAINDYIEIKRAIAVKASVDANLNATFSFSGDGYKLTQSIKDFQIYSQKIAGKLGEALPEESVIVRFVAKDLVEEMS